MHIEHLYCSSSKYASTSLSYVASSSASAACNKQAGRQRDRQTDRHHGHQAAWPEDHTPNWVLGMPLFLPSLVLFCFQP